MMHTQEYARACTLMRGRSVESTISNHQLNLLSTQHSLQYRPQQSGLSGNCMPHQKEAIMKAQKQQQLLFIDMKNTTGIFWAKTDKRLLFLFLISAATIWDMAQRANECSGLWSQVPAELQRPEQRPEHITENIAKWKLVKFGFYLNLFGICHFGRKLTGTTIYYTYCKLPPISGGTDVTRTKKLLSLWANK